MRRREIATDPARLPLRDMARGRNFYEELMQCPPGVEPEGSIADGGALRTLIDEALQGLSQHELVSQRGRMRFVLEACIIERRSLREIGRALGLSKTHVARVRDAGLQHLREQLASNPRTLEVLGE